MSLSFTHGVACERVSFFLKAKFYSFACPYHTFFIRSSVGGHLDCLFLLAIVTKAMVSVGCTSLWDSSFKSFGYVFQGGIAGLCAVPFLMFCGIPVLFFIVAGPFYIPLNSA